jgi:hypothetical protein
MTSSNFVACSIGRSPGFAPFENLRHEDGGTAIQILQARPKGHQASSLSELLENGRRRQPVPGRKVCDKHSLTEHKGVIYHEESPGAAAEYGSQGGIEIVGPPHLHRSKL